MTDTLAYLLIALGATAIVLQLIALLRRARFETPADLDARLRLLEQPVQALVQASARVEGQVDRLAREMDEFTRATAAAFEAHRRALDDKQQDMVDEGRSGRQELASAFRAFEDKVEQRLQALAQVMNRDAEQLRATLNERLQALQADNTRKLDEMRQTVDEKLHATLEQRLGESFRLVSERLEQVHAGLGEMKTLAGSVGDLKRVMTNVRARGTWGEMQLGAIIESLLTAEQFERNVKTVPGSNELVEFAIRLPGRGDEQPVWLPIDSKYPVEDYQRLLDAHETVDKGVIAQAATAFEASIRNEAKKIAAKYVAPPHTTDFAILFVPTEGLFAEVMRCPGLAESLQTDHRVVVAGPTTLAAMLNSLRVGFRTLAIEKRSSEVWAILATVKTEFGKFGEIVDSTRKSIETAANKFTELGRRTRAIEKGLRDVQELPASAAPLAIAAVLASADDDRDDATG